MDKALKEFISGEEVSFALLSGLALNQELAILKLSTGSKEHLFSLSLMHLKRLSLLLVDNVAAYEKAYGELKTDLQRPIVSPIQPKK